MERRLAVLFLILFAQSGIAAVFDIADGDVTALKTAITTANSNGADDTINLAPKGTYKLTSADNGANGLPIVMSDTTDKAHTLTINGNGATIDGSDILRVLQIAGGANVTINYLTIARGGGVLVAPSFEGAGILNFGQLQLTASTITGCHIIGDATSGTPVTLTGAGVSNHGVCTVIASTIDNNKADFGSTATSGHGESEGGGIFNVGTLTLSNSTIVSNVAEGSNAQQNASAGTASGGGIYNEGSAAATNCTIVSNTAIAGSSSGAPAIPAHGGGVYQAAGTFTFLNTIVGYDRAGTYGGAIVDDGIGPDVSGTITSNGHNLVRNADGGGPWNATGDKVGNGSDPLSLGTLNLADNGGPTQTIALGDGSPAIDAGDDAVVDAPLNLATDQRGLPRKQGAHVDIGAFEFDPPQSGPAFVVTNTSDHDDSSCGILDCSLREAINASNSATGANTISFAAGVAGTITLLAGPITVLDDVTITGPGAKVLTVDRNNKNRVLYVVAKEKANVSGLTFTHGNFGSSAGAAQGGGIFVAGNLTLTECMVTNSYAAGGISGSTATAGQGGGIFVDFGATLTLVRSTITGNGAYGGYAPVKSGGITGGDAFGGGIYVNVTATAFGTLAMENCTVSGNTAQGGRGSFTFGNAPGGNGFGGGIYDPGPATIAASTIAANTANAGSGGSSGAIGRGGGFYSEDPSFNGLAQVSGTIIATNTSTTDSPDAFGSFASQGYNLIGNKSGSVGFNQSTDKNGSANLAALADNGGPTLTHALQAGSAAIDASNTQLPTDQRGAPRPFGNASDIGAFEFGAVVPTPTPTPSPTPTATPTATATPTPPSQLENLSTRKQVGTGDNVLIGGFIVVGSADKKVLLRGVGPSLPVGGALQDPTLELHDSSSALIAFNDNWQEAPNAAEIGSILPPSNDLESAILTSLPAKPAGEGGAGYTGVLAGKGGTTGIGLLEIYDLDMAANSELANISTRGFVGTGDDVLIGGFIPGPSDRMPLRLLVRGLGPSLANQGVGGALQDPLLELHDSNGGVVATNDNWKDAPNASEIAATGAPPSDDREAAIVTTLPPATSGYTAIVRGVNGSTGIGLVEVFDLGN